MTYALPTKLILKYTKRIFQYNIYKCSACTVFDYNYVINVILIAPCQPIAVLLRCV